MHLGQNDAYWKEAMKVTIKRGDEIIELSDLSFEQAKEIAGVNGHRRTSASRQRALHFAGQETSAAKEEPDYKGFWRAISDKGRKFFRIIEAHPNGIDALSMVTELGLKSTPQVGGFAAGELSRFAKKNGVDLQRVYKSEAVFENGVRTRTYRPGPDISLLVTKPR